VTILSVFVAGLSIAVSLAIDPHADNREVSVILVPEDRQRADYWKTQSLDREGGTFTARWDDLPAGTYAVMVLLRRYPLDGSADEVEVSESAGEYLYAGAYAVGTSKTDVNGVLMDGP
jgi:hypothetical protein